MRYRSKELIEKELISSWNSVFSVSEERVNETYEVIRKAKMFFEDEDLNNSDEYIYEIFDEFIGRIMGVQRND